MKQLSKNTPLDSEETEDKLEGRNPVLEALKSGREIDKIFVAKGERQGSISQIIAIAKENKIVIVEVDKRKLDEMSQTKAHQGVIAAISSVNYVEVEDILKLAREKNQPPFIIIADEINDPHNLGSIIRTAHCAGAHGVIIPKRRSVGLTSVVAKSSAGAINYTMVAKVSNTTQTIEKLKKEGIWVMGLDADGAGDLYHSNLKGAVAIVVGSEGEGLGRLVKESCDFLVNIPMRGEITSLNASVAAALAMYEVVRQNS